MLQNCRALHITGKLLIHQSHQAPSIPDLTKLLAGQPEGTQSTTYVLLCPVQWQRIIALRYYSHSTEVFKEHVLEASQPSNTRFFILFDNHIKVLEKDDVLATILSQT